MSITDNNLSNKICPELCLDTIHMEFIKLIRADNFPKKAYFNSNAVFFEKILPNSLLNQTIHTDPRKKDNKYSFYDMFIYKNRDRHYDLGFWGAEGGKSSVPNDVYLNISLYFMDNGVLAFETIVTNISKILEENFKNDKQLYAKKWIDNILETAKDEIDNEFLSTGRLFDHEVNLKPYIISNHINYIDLLYRLAILIIASIFPVDYHDKSITLNISRLVINKIPTLVNNSTINCLGFEVPNPKLYRNDEYKRAFDYLSDLDAGKRTLLITGFGGDGKTTLATWLYNSFSSERNSKYGNVIWIDYKNNLDESFLGSLDLEYLQPTQTNICTNLSSAFIEQEYNKKIKAIEALLNNKHNDRILMIIDNYSNSLSETDAVKKFQDHFKIEDILSVKYPRLDVVITARHNNSGVLSRLFKKAKNSNNESNIIELLSISNETARELFLAYYDSNDIRDYSIIDRIIQKSSNNILAVQLLALSARESLLPLDNFLAALEKMRFQFPKTMLKTNHSIMNCNDYEDASEQIRKLYSLINVSKEEEKTLWAFALLKSGLGFSIQEIDSLFFVGCSQSAINLYKNGWLQYSAHDGFIMHEIVRKAILLNLKEANATIDFNVDPKVFGISFITCIDGFAPFSDFYIESRRFLYTDKVLTLHYMNDLKKRIDVLDACLVYLLLPDIEKIRILYCLCLETCRLFSLSERFNNYISIFQKILEIKCLNNTLIPNCDLISSYNNKILSTNDDIHIFLNSNNPSIYILDFCENYMKMTSIAADSFFMDANYEQAVNMNILSLYICLLTATKIEKIDASRLTDKMDTPTFSRFTFLWTTLIDGLSSLNTHDGLVDLSTINYSEIIRNTDFCNYFSWTLFAIIDIIYSKFIIDPSYLDKSINLLNIVKDILDIELHINSTFSNFINQQVRCYTFLGTLLMYKSNKFQQTSYNYFLNAKELFEKYALTIEKFNDMENHTSYILYKNTADFLCSGGYFKEAKELYEFYYSDAFCLSQLDQNENQKFFCSKSFLFHYVQCCIGIYRCSLSLNESMTIDLPAIIDKSIEYSKSFEVDLNVIKTFTENSNDFRWISAVYHLAPPKTQEYFIPILLN